MVGFETDKTAISESIQESQGIDLVLLIPDPGFSNEIKLGTLSVTVGVNEMKSTADIGKCHEQNML